MKTLRLAVLILLILLGLAAGTAKVMRNPQELEFFSASLGFNATMVMVLGAAQMLAAVLMMKIKTRLPGALLLDITLLVSTAAIFLSGDIKFGLISIVPIVLNSLLIFDLVRHLVLPKNVQS